MTTETSYLLTLLMGMILGLLSAHIAMRKERNPLLWFMIGFFFGVIGLFVLFLVQPMGFGSDSSAEESAPSSETTSDGIQSAKEDHTHQGLSDALDSSDWYYLDRDWQQRGPVPLAQLQKLWQEGQIEDATLVWHPSLPQWQSIISLSKLVEHLAQS